MSKIEVAMRCNDCIQFCFRERQKFASFQPSVGGSVLVAPSLGKLIEFDFLILGERFSFRAEGADIISVNLNTDCPTLDRQSPA